ncbi:MAG: SAM-dependent methyltransferase [Oscillospiraceae bacterium]|nr:SAM-dependent methyltransferase [Oscillospiraceae bacterium]
MTRKLGARLLSVVRKIPVCETLVDCGCDHGYVSIYASEKNLAKYITASDINEGPLKNAKKEIEAAGFSSRIKTVLTDGLSGIPRHDCVVIAGMGGETVFEIISRSEWTRDGCKLVLQPMTKSEILREELYRAGFSVYDESFVYENGHMYCIICAEYSGKTEYDLFEKYISRAGLSHENADEYISRVLRRLSYEYENKARAGTIDKEEKELRRAEIEELKKLCRQ